MKVDRHPATHICDSIHLALTRPLQGKVLNFSKNYHMGPQESPLLVAGEVLKACRAADASVLNIQSKL